jgi:hypothetical protein
VIHYAILLDGAPAAMAGSRNEANMKLQAMIDERPSRAGRLSIVRREGMHHNWTSKMFWAVNDRMAAKPA